MWEVEVFELISMFVRPVRFLKIVNHKKQGPGNESVNDKFPEIISMSYIHTVRTIAVYKGPKLFLLNIHGFFSSYPENDVENGPQDEKINESFFDFI